MSDKDNLEIVDTSDVLTKDELLELKRLASLSKTTRTFFVFAMALVAIFGIDRLVDFLQAHH